VEESATHGKKEQKEIFGSLEYSQKSLNERNQGESIARARQAKVNRNIKMREDRAREANGREFAKKGF
jgi:hypothetical protein